MGERTPLDLTGGPYRLGIIGDPVAHSLSPALHQPALDQLGLHATYERWHTVAGDVPNRVASLRDPLVLGASITVPHKLAVMPLLDDISRAALRAGAVNTIVNRGGSLHGENTDIYGFGVTVSQVFEGNAPSVALVLGAGGAARAVVLALEAVGVEEIVVANRDVQRAVRLARDLDPAPVRVSRLDDEALNEEMPRAGLLVNATSLGWRRGELPIDSRFLGTLPEGAVVADLTYRDTDLLLAAAARCLRTVDGLAMLIHQGARAFTLWTGYPAPLTTMANAAQAARNH